MTKQDALIEVLEQLLKGKQPFGDDWKIEPLEDGMVRIDGRRLAFPPFATVR